MKEYYDSYFATARSISDSIEQVKVLPSSNTSTPHSSTTGKRGITINDQWMMCFLLLSYHQETVQAVPKEMLPTATP